MDKQNTTGIILAGGKSARMGADKGFVIYNGATFMSLIIDALQPFVNEIIIVSNYSEYDVFKLKRVKDKFEDAGPLAGLYSGLEHSETEKNIVLSCDVPLINNAVLNVLVEGFDAKVDVVQLKSNGETMPLIAMYKKRSMHQILDLLQQGERRLRVAVATLQTKTITLDPKLKSLVRNINSSSQLKKIRNECED